jgi:hypothetical protein
MSYRDLHLAWAKLVEHEPSVAIVKRDNLAHRLSSALHYLTEESLARLRAELLKEANDPGAWTLLDFVNVWERRREASQAQV